MVVWNSNAAASAHRSTKKKCPASARSSCSSYDAHPGSATDGGIIASRAARSASARPGLAVASATIRTSALMVSFGMR